jgi:mono/diheme cytochrome c family protein
MIAIASAIALACATAAAQTPPSQEQSQDFPPEQIRAGAALFDRNCAPCHGSHMEDPESAFDLRTFPHDQHSRFVESVTKGKNSMPPWGGQLKPEDIEALWSYVVAGEKPADASKTDTSKTGASKSKDADSKDSESKSDDSKNGKKNPDKAKADDHSRPEH